MTTLLTAAPIALGLTLAPAIDDPATLHPQGALAYVEVPDVQAVFRAYGETAFARVLTDEEIHASLAMVMGEEEFDPVAFVLGQYEAAVESGQVPPVLELMIHPLESISASFHVEGGRLDTMIAEIEALEREGKYQEAEAHALAAMGFQVVLGFESDESAGRAYDFLIETATQMGVEPEANELDGGGWIATFPELGPDAESLRLIGRGKRVAALFGGLDTAGLLARFAGDRDVASVATGPELRLGSKYFSESSGTTVIEGYSVLGDQLLPLVEEVPVGPLVSLAEGLFGPIVSMTVRGGHWRVQLREGRFVTDGFHRPQHFTPLDRLFASAPLSESALSLIHPDAIVGWAVQMEPQILADALSELSRAGGGDFFADIEAEYGFRPDRDLIAPLGPAVAYSLPPVKSLFAAPPLMVAIALEDPEAFATGIDGAMRVLGDEFGEVVTVRKSEYRGASLYEMSFRIEELENAGLPFDPAALLRPTIAILPDRVFVTTLPNHAKREVRRILKGEFELHPMLAAHGVPEGAGEVGFADWTSFLGKIYSGLSSVAPLFAGMTGEELPFDLSSLPKAELFTRHFEPTVRWKRSVDGGVVHHVESSFGPETPVVLATAIGGAVLWSTVGVPSGGPPEPPFEVVEHAHGDATAKQVQAQLALSELKVALTVYKLDQGGFPAALADLTVATASYPKGFLSTPDLAPDPWGHAYRYRQKPDGFRLWSSGPNGVDEDGAGDDIVSQ